MDHETIIARKADTIRVMVAKYSIDFPTLRGAHGVGSEQEAALVTGTTGRLGSHLLGCLAQNPAVRHVYALNRSSPRNTDQVSALVARQKAALKQCELDAVLLDSGKVTILPANYADDRLGLDAASYTEIENSVITIIHNGTFCTCVRLLAPLLTDMVQLGASTLTSASRASSRSSPAYAR
jgi:hypothetical protein